MLPLLTDLTVTHLSRCQAVTRDGENTLAECTNAGGGDLKWFCLVCQIQLVDGKRSSNQIKIIFDVSKKCLLRIRCDRGGKSVRKQWLINIFRVINRLQQGFPNDVSVTGYLSCLIWFVQYIFYKLRRSGRRGVKPQTTTPSIRSRSLHLAFLSSVYF